MTPQNPFIRQEGTVYYLTRDMIQEYSITINRNNIIFDGAGYSIKCANYPLFPNAGLNLQGVTNVTVKNVTVTGFNGGYLEDWYDGVYYDGWLGDVVAHNTNASTFIGVSTEVFRLINSYYNTITQCNISSDNDFRRPAVGVSVSHNNTFFENNFFFPGEITPFDWLEPKDGRNFWDNGSVGNYWRYYEGSDVNCDGIGDTPFKLASEAQDRFPLMYPWDPAKPIDRAPPRIGVSSPQNMIYNDSSVALAFLVCEPVSWMGYSLDGQDNITVTGNTTLSGLGNGAYNLTVYATDLAGNTGASETCSFTVSAPFPIVPVAAIFGLAIAAATVCLLFYKKRSTTTLKSPKMNLEVTPPYRYNILTPIYASVSFLVSRRLS